MKHRVGKNKETPEKEAVHLHAAANKTSESKVNGLINNGSVVLKRKSSFVGYKSV